MRLIDKLPQIRGSYRENVDLSKTTWFRVGGHAEILFKPADSEDLAYFIKNKPLNVPYTILGVGSNLLVRDGGIKGVVIKLGKGFNEIAINDHKIIVGAGVLSANVAKFALEHNISGVEFLIGIPGSVGGGIAMNAGAYGSEFANILLEVEVVDASGNIKWLKAKELGFYYRGNKLPDDWIFTKAYLTAKPGNSQEIKALMDSIMQQREQAQPVRARTSGSSFANPSNSLKAWELIDEAGCRGLKIGGAMVSDKHCNFLINMGNAKARDIENLGDLVREKVFAKSKIMLEWEIKRVGEEE